MAGMIAWLTKTLLSEKVLKMVLCAIGDYLVASSKNTLDDKIWDKVKKVLKVG